MAMTKPTSDQINFQNSVVLPQSLTVDGTTLVVDGTNNRVGIGVAAPTTALDVAGNALITGNATVTSNATVTGNATISGTLSLNAGYGSVAPVFGCRAWINFDGTTFANTTTWQGGTSTATRASGSTTCTITTSSPHGLLVGHAVTPTSTVLDAAIITYGVTSTTTNTFTITTAATSALSSASVAFSWQGIRASGNIHSVSRVGQGDYYLNFQTSMPDSHYCLVSTGSDNSGDSTFRSTNTAAFTMQGTAVCRIFHKAVNSVNQQFEDGHWICAAIFR